MKNGKKYDESEKKHIGVRKKKKVNQARTKGHKLKNAFGSRL